MLEKTYDGKKDASMSDRTIPAAGARFEASFMSRDLNQQIEQCDHYELADHFKRWLPEHQPILEAGCGSGR